MRLKAIPRRRRPNNLYAATKGSRENVRSKNITQDVNEELTNITEYRENLDSTKKLEARRYEVPGGSGDFNPMQFTSGKYIAEVYSSRDVKSSIEETFTAVNLSTKNSSAKNFDSKNEILNGPSAPDGTNTGDKFAGSLLYKIMTDPTFVDSIKNNKQMAKLTCKFCKNRFGNYDELQNHFDSRLDKLDRITCCACGKTFGQKRYLRYHQRCHVVNDKFACDICAKKYSRMDNLTRHRAYHTNPGKYPCHICSKAFSRRDLMTKHFKSHDEKKLNCDLCKANFVNSVEMKAHRLTLHTVINIDSNNKLTPIEIQ